jgi:hypothetical protein
VARIKKEVSDYYATVRSGGNKDGSAYFYAVEAPSGSGKTLLPFALAAAKMRVRQFVLSALGECSQEIYATFLQRSSTLRLALKNDLDGNNGLDAECTISTLFSTNNYRKLQTVAVLSKLLGLTATADPHEFRRLVVSALQDLPLIVVDEVLSGSSSTEKTQLKLLRNILRGAGVVSMYMGTNANIDACLSQLEKKAGGGGVPPGLCLPI